MKEKWTVCKIPAGLCVFLSFYVCCKRKLKYTKIDLGEVDQQPEVKIRNRGNENQFFSVSVYNSEITMKVKGKYNLLYNLLSI